MSVRRLAVLVTIIAVLAACGPPVVDTASPDDLVGSVSKIRESLEGEQLARFDDAFDELTNGALLAGNPESLRTEVEACAPVHGMTAAQIIATAWSTRVTRTTRRIAELSELRDASSADRAVLAGMEIVEATLYPASAGFLASPVVELELANHTRRRIYNITFQASLRRPDELEPLVVELVDRPFGAGLSPGNQVTVRLELTDSEWRRVAATPGNTFACSVMALEGWRHRTIARTDFGAVQEYLLAALGRRLEELEAQKPVP